MIRLILGQPGSGKTISAVKWLIDHKQTSYTNFVVRRENIIRLLVEHIIQEVEDKKKVNWDYWKGQIRKLGAFHICIDELHNIMHARTSMTKKNILMSQWVAQIRKVTGENERSDLVCISQELERVDISVRDLTYQIIACQKHQSMPMIETTVYERGVKKVKNIPKTLILRYYFTGAGCLERYRQWRDFRHKTYNSRSYFYANPYMRYYDSYELVDFGEGAYL